MINLQIVKPAYAIICNKLLDPNCDDAKGQILNPTGYFGSVIQALFSIFMVVAVIYFVWHFIMGAHHFIDSSGDSKKIEEAQKQVTYAFVGLFIAFSIFAILKLIGIIFGVDSLQTLTLPIPTLWF